MYGQSLDMQLLPEGSYENQNFRPKHVKELHFCQSFISGVKGTTDGRLFIQLFKYLFIENSCTCCALRQSIVRSKFCRGEPTKTKEEQEDRCLYYIFFGSNRGPDSRTKRQLLKVKHLGGKNPSICNTVSSFQRF